jgi:hypothetical protein
LKVKAGPPFFSHLQEKEGGLLVFIDRYITTHYFIISIEFFASLFYEISRKAEKSLRARNIFSELSFMICSTKEDILK